MKKMREPQVCVRNRGVEIGMWDREIGSYTWERYTVAQALDLACALCEALAPEKKSRREKRPAAVRGVKCKGGCRKCLGGGCGR